MYANGVIPFDPGLVTQSVNYHGHNLLKHLVSENASQIHTIKLQDIDYKIYQSRNTELRNLGASRIQEIVGFIASKSDQLLVAQPKLPKSEESKEVDYEDRYKHQFPYEYFLNVNKNTRIQEFMNVVEVGDILYAEVVTTLENTNFTALKFIAYDGGKHRYLTDIKATDLKLVLKNEDTIVSKADEDKLGRWMCGTRLRVEVISIHITSSVPCLLVGTKGVTLESTSREHIKLGKVQIKDLPQILSVTPDPSVRYLSSCIEKMNSYKNPQCIRQMAAQLNIDMHWYPSLFNSFRQDISESETASSLRKAQMCKWAHKNVADGVTHFKKGQHEEAFQCLNKALQIDPDNVEAFVAKGALLANLGRYEKATEDFEKALASNPDHVNARKYMCETLVELGRQKEEKDQLKEAEKCYSRCLELNEHHEIAGEALDSVSRKLGPESSVLKVIKLESINTEDNYLADLLQIEQELNNKRRASEENPIPTITTKMGQMGDPIPLVEAEEDESQMSMEGSSLSPLSQKLADQESLWYHPPSSSMPITSFTHSLVPTDNRLDMNMFSNPPPIWPVADVYKPPPVLPLGPKPNSEDQNYNARVEEFLKELETRSLGEKIRRKSDSIGREARNKTKQKDEKKERKRRRSSSSSNSSSSGSSSDSGRRNSSSSSSSSSSNSSSNSSGGSRKGKRKASKKSKKIKNKKKKKSLKKKEKEKEKEKKPTEIDVAASVPDFGDLEEKLMAYYKKMEAMNTVQDPKDLEVSRKSSSRSSSNGPEKRTKTRNIVEALEESTKKEAEKIAIDKCSSVPLSKSKLVTHPAFLEAESDDEVVPKDAKLPRNSAPSRPQEEKKSIGVKTKKPIANSLLTKRKCKSRSYSRSRSRSQSRSRSRRSRSRYRGKRSRSRSRGKRSRSRSRGKRSRSRTRGKRSPKYKYSRQRSRSRSRLKNSKRRSRSKSASRSYRRSRSKERPKACSRSPFGYYRNKPVFGKDKINELNKNLVSRGDPSPRDSKPVPEKLESKRNLNPKMISVVEDAKRKIIKHIANNAKEFTASVRSFEEKDGKKSTSSIDSSSRFGKWGNEVDKQKDNCGPKKPALEGSLDQFESFLKNAKVKNMELMKERNKAFLKPNVD